MLYPLLHNAFSFNNWLIEINIAWIIGMLVKFETHVFRISPRYIIVNKPNMEIHQNYDFSSEVIKIDINYFGKKKL